MLVDFVPIRELGAELDGRTMVLLDNDGCRRFGAFDRHTGRWMSTVEPRLVLRPVAAMDVPRAP